MATAKGNAISQVEFIALMAMLAATVAFSIDAMLPALPEIGQELTPDALNKAQLIITSFVLGMGAGTFFTGPLSDAYGRKPVMVGGAIVYMVAAAIAWFAPSLELILAARFLQGLGAAGPRVVALAMVRDLYGGRDMARIVSFVMLIFSLVPALAPTMGYFIIEGFGWRAIFITFILFSIVSVFWLGKRQPETLAPENRRPLRISNLVSATKEVFSNETTRLSILVQTLTFGILFSELSSVQQIFDVTFGQGDHFHLWFGGIAVLAATSSLLNARLVIRLGMRAIIRSMFIALIAVSLVLILVWFAFDSQSIRFAAFLLFVVACFFGAGMTIGNLNALALEPVGHIAGLAASIVAAVSTVGAIFIAVPIGLMFNGTPVPLAFGVLICSIAAFWLTTKIKRPGET